MIVNVMSVMSRWSVLLVGEFRVQESIQPPVRNLQTLITVRLYQLFLF